MGSTANVQAVAKPQVFVAPAYAVTVGAPFYVAQYLACIKLADISGYFKKAPMTKNLKGYIYLNYNSSISSITTNAVGVVSPGQICVSNNMQFGNTCPVMWNFSSANATSAGLSTGLAVPTGTILRVTADVNGTQTAGAGRTPAQSFARLLVPSYSPNPSADHALSQKKTFRYFERITNRFTVLHNQSFTYTITNGIANPKKLVMMPVISNLSTANDATADVINPLRSPFSTVLATCSPFASIKNLQVTVGNLPCYNTPISFGFDQYLFETANSGADGGLDSTTTSGLLSQQLWESLYRYVVVDLGRRLPSEDGASKSIIVSGTSNCAYPLTIYYHVWRDAVATVDTSMGTVSEGSVQSS